MHHGPPAFDLTRTAFELLVMGLLLAATFWVLSPFLPSLIWAATIVISSWPLMRAVQQRLWRSRALAVAVMTIALLLVLIVPLFVALSTVAGNVDNARELARTLSTQGLPQPPAWIEQTPIVGASVAQAWRDAAASGGEELISELTPYVGRFLSWLMAQIGGLGMLFLHFVVTVILSALLYFKGEVAARGIIRFARRLAPSQGEQIVRLAAQAARAVAIGVVVTALLQTAMAAVGLLVAGVPYAMVLSSIIFLMAVVQLGAAPVLALVTIWLFSNDSTLTASLFLAWSLLVVTADNFIRPLLIKAGADLPLLLIFAGVVGGLISFGIIGLFIGPVVLAVSFTLLKAWVEAAPTP